MLFLFENHYRQLGYRHNPFQELSRDDFTGSFPPGADIRELLAERFHVLQIVGGSGFGKSTLLRHIADYLLKQGEFPLFHYVQSRTDMPAVSKAETSWLLLDEAQRIRKDLFLPEARRWRHEGISLVLGSHMDHESWFGNEFCVKTVYLHTMTAPRLHLIWQRFLDQAALTEPRHRFPPETLEILLKCSDGSLRTARMICFEIFTMPDLPPVIGPDLVQSAADAVLKNLRITLRQYE